MKGDLSIFNLSVRNLAVGSIVLWFIFVPFLLFSRSLYLGPSCTPNFSSKVSSDHIRVFVAPLPRSFNYGLLDLYWSQVNNTRIGSEADTHMHQSLFSSNQKISVPPYPENPIIKQYSAEYWILGDLMTPEHLRQNSFAKRVSSYEEADVVFVPFFATMSAELQLGIDRGKFEKKSGNEDFERQQQVMDLIKGSKAWKISGGRDHVFVLTDPVSMWHSRAQLSPAILLVVDFGGWYKVDAKAAVAINNTNVIHHTQVSLLKDVIIPYTHLLPRFSVLNGKKRSSILYFRGARHRHRGGVIRDKLWDLLVNEPDVVIEEGFPDSVGCEQAIEGMRSSEFCLHLAGDTPTSCRLFDAIQSLCIPVIVSDAIELPFEGLVDYSKFSIFISTTNASQPNYLTSYLKGLSEEHKISFRRAMAKVQPFFVYDNGYHGGIGPIPVDGAVNHIWKKVYQKLPFVKEAIVREKRKPVGVSIPLRCHCT